MNTFEVFEIEEYVGTYDIECCIRNYLDKNNKELVSVSAVYNPNQHCYLLFVVSKQAEVAAAKPPRKERGKQW